MDSGGADEGFRRASRFSAFATLVGSLVVVGSLLFGAGRVSQSEAEVAGLSSRADSLRTVSDSLERDIAVLQQTAINITRARLEAASPPADQPAYASGTDTEDPIERRFQCDLLAPLAIHFDSTQTAFNAWTSYNPQIESIIGDNNLAARDLILDNAYLLPPELTDEASRLVVHYDAWFEQYGMLREAGQPDTSVAFVFAGPGGFPFPSDAEASLLGRLDELEGEYGPCPGG